MEEKKRYKVVEHTADVAIKAFGKNIPEMFENAAIGMFDIISDTQKVDCIGEYEIRLVANDLEQLLVDWLSELLSIFDTRNIIIGKSKIDFIDKKDDVYRLKGKIYGETFNTEKHTSGVEIKAVTYHMLEVNEKEGFIKVLFDI